jgi:hypothetical protein
METRGLARFAPLTGVAFVVLLIPVFFLGGEPPDADEKLPKVLDFWKSNDSELIIGALLAGIAAVFLLWFSGVLRSELRTAEGGTGRVSTTAYAGGIVLATWIAFSASIQFAAADTAGDVAPAVTQTLSVLNTDAFFGFAVGTATILFAAGGLFIRTGFLPGWLGWISVLLGIAALTPAGFVAFIGLMIWIVAVSIVLFRRTPAAPTPAAPAV